MTTKTSTRSSTAVLLWLLPVALLLFLFSNRRIPIYDGGLPLSLALRVLHGDVPHRDFYYQYGPAQPFLFAFLFRLFGVHMLAVTIAEMTIKAGTVLVSYLVVRRVASVPAALYSAAVIGLLLTTAYPSAGMDVLLIVAAFLLFSSNCFVAVPSSKSALSTGLLAGGAGIFRYEQGPMLLLLYFFLIALGWILRSKRERVQDLFEAGLIALAGYLILTVPLFLYFALHHALHDLVWQCFTFARLYYRAARHLPFPTDPFHHREQIVLFLPIVVPPLALAYLAARGRRDRAWLATAQATLIVSLALLALFYAVKGSIRVDFGQMLPGNVAVAMLVAVLLGSTHPKFVRIISAFVALVALVGTLVFCKTLFRTWQKQGTLQMQTVLHTSGSHDVEGWCGAPLPLTAPLCFSMNSDHEQAVLYLSAHVPAGSRLYVGLPHHDTVYAGDNLTYFATNTVPSVKWSHFDPDLQTSEDVQRTMIADLERFHPAYAVETSEFEGNNEPNDSSKSSGVRLLDNYLQANYSQVAQFGTVSVLQRQSGGTH